MPEVTFPDPTELTKQVEEYHRNLVAKAIENSVAHGHSKIKIGRYHDGSNIILPKELEGKIIKELKDKGYNVREIEIKSRDFDPTPMETYYIVSW